VSEAFGVGFVMRRLLQGHWRGGSEQNQVQAAWRCSYRAVWCVSGQPGPAYPLPPVDHDKTLYRISTLTTPVLWKP